MIGSLLTLSGRSKSNRASPKGQDVRAVMMLTTSVIRSMLSAFVAAKALKVPTDDASALVASALRPWLSRSGCHRHRS